MRVEQAYDDSKERMKEERVHSSYKSYSWANQVIFRYGNQVTTLRGWMNELNLSVCVLSLDN